LVQAIKMLKYNVIFHKKIRQSTLHMHKKSKKFGDFGGGQKNKNQTIKIAYAQKK